MIFPGASSQGHGLSTGDLVDLWNTWWTIPGPQLAPAGQLLERDSGTFHGLGGRPLRPCGRAEVHAAFRSARRSFSTALRSPRPLRRGGRDPRARRCCPGNPSRRPTRRLVFSGGSEGFMGTGGGGPPQVAGVHVFR